MKTEHAFKITHVTACTPGGLVKDAEIVVDNGRIESIRQRGGNEHLLPEIDGGGCYALPGFIDIHCHGAALYDLTAGAFDPDTSTFDASADAHRRGLSHYVRAKAREGVANFVIGTWAAPAGTVRTAFHHLAHYMASDANGVEGPLVLGGLLEGAFFNPLMAGAQNPEFASEPAREVFDELNESGAIKLANVVPDFGEASYKLTEYLAQRGIVVGAGHTNATGEQFTKAVERGLRYAIHFTNGPTGGSFKPFGGGGVIEAVLSSDGVYAELICDLYHVSPAYIRDIIVRKGHDKIIAVTDQIFVTGTELRHFRIGPLEGEVAADKSHVWVANARTPCSNRIPSSSSSSSSSSSPTLFGSCLTMDAAFSNIVSMLTREISGVWNRTHDALPLSDAVSAAAKMCSTNPAKLLARGTGFQPVAGHAQDGRATDGGALEPGRWADIVLGTLSGGPGDYRFAVRSLFVRGRRHRLSSE